MDKSNNENLGGIWVVLMKHRGLAHAQGLQGGKTKVGILNEEKKKEKKEE